MTEDDKIKGIKILVVNDFAEFELRVLSHMTRKYAAAVIYDSSHNLSDLSELYADDEQFYGDGSTTAIEKRSKMLKQLNNNGKPWKRQGKHHGRR